MVETNAGGSVTVTEPLASGLKVNAWPREGLCVCCEGEYAVM